MTPEICAFLRDHIESHEELELLLLIFRHRERDWTANAAADELRIPPTIARDALESLHRERLLHAHRNGAAVSFRADQQVPETTRVIERLVEAYQEQRFEIAALLASHAIERLRTRALRTFSDSFIIGRKRDRNG